MRIILFLTCFRQSNNLNVLETLEIVQKAVKVSILVMTRAITIIAGKRKSIKSFSSATVEFINFILSTTYETLRNRVELFINIYSGISKKMSIEVDFYLLFVLRDDYL